MENTERRGQRGDKEKAKEEGEGRRRRREKEERGGRDREGEKEEKEERREGMKKNTGRRADFMGTTDWVLCHV